MKQTLRLIAALLLCAAFTPVGAAWAQGPDVSGVTWSGWTDLGSSVTTGAFASGGKANDYQIYAAVFTYCSTTVPVPGASSGFVNGRQILGIGIRNNSGASGSPTFKLDPNNNSYNPDATGSAGDGKSSFTSDADLGDASINTFGGNPGEISIRNAGTLVANGPPCVFAGGPCFYLVNGGNWAGDGQPGLRGISPAPGMWKTFFDLAQLTAELGPGGARNPSGPHLGAFGSAITVAVGGLGGTEAVVKVVLDPPSGIPPVCPTPTATTTPAPTSTPTASPSPTFTPSATATPAPQRRALYLPLLLHERCPKVDAPPLDIVLLIDASTSMRSATRAGRSKIDAALEAADLPIRLVGGRSRLAIVSFNTEATQLVELTGDRGRLKAALAALRTREGSRLDAGLRAARHALEASPPGTERRVVGLTDGRPSPSTPDDVRAAAAELRAAGIVLDTIGLGEDLDAALLREIASDAARYHAAPDAEDLGAIFEDMSWAPPLCGGLRLWPSAHRSPSLGF